MPPKVNNFKCFTQYPGFCFSVSLLFIQSLFEHSMSLVSAFAMEKIIAIDIIFALKKIIPLWILHLQWMK